MRSMKGGGINHPFFVLPPIVKWELKWDLRIEGIVSV